MLLSLSITVNLLLVLSFAHGQTDDLVISLNVPNSKIRGHTLKSHLGKDYYGFQDIPYAVPPIGENRYSEPKSHPGWSGVLNTTQNTKVCVQDGGVTTEDCLVINVYTPVVNGSGKLPVMVWIHGGAFMGGSGRFEDMNPQYFMDYGIIVVTINYRLGPFGFLTTEDDVIPGNLGLKDQLLALKWVNKNIDVFGGDPNKVTISGQSAGSISVSFHIVSQKSAGLFRGAIMESGTALTHGSYIAHGRNYSFQLGRLLDNSFTSDDSKDLLKVLKKASAQEILAASEKVERIGKQVGVLTDLIWAVVIESKNQKNSFITDPMQGSFANGQFEKVPILIGYTSEETIAFMGSAENVKISAAEHDKSTANLISFKWNVAVKNQEIAGAKLKKFYTNSTFEQKLASFISFSSDVGFVNAIVHEAYLSSKHIPVYLYEFSYKGTMHHDPTNIPNLQGVGHAEELYYMWRWLSESPADVLTSKRLLTMWSNFIKELNPTPAADPELGIPVWQRVQTNNLVYMDIGSSLVLKNNPKKYLGAKAIFDQYLEPPYNVY